MMRKLYVLFALIVIGGYAYAGWTGMELRQRKKGFVPQGVRGTHGGARSVWYSGYRGGK
jgi:hypothetical protein